MMPAAKIDPTHIGQDVPEVFLHDSKRLHEII